MSGWYDDEGGTATMTGEGPERPERRRLRLVTPEMRAAETDRRPQRRRGRRTHRDRAGRRLFRTTAVAAVRGGVVALAGWIVYAHVYREGWEEIRAALRRAGIPRRDAEIAGTLVLVSLGAFSRDPQHRDLWLELGGALAVLMLERARLTRWWRTYRAPVRVDTLPASLVVDDGETVVTREGRPTLPRGERLVRYAHERHSGPLERVYQTLYRGGVPQDHPGEADGSWTISDPQRTGLEGDPGDPGETGTDDRGEADGSARTTLERGQIGAEVGRGGVLLTPEDAYPFVVVGYDVHDSEGGYLMGQEAALFDRRKPDGARLYGRVEDVAAALRAAAVLNTRLARENAGERRR